MSESHQKRTSSVEILCRLYSSRCITSILGTRYRMALRPERLEVLPGCARILKIHNFNHLSFSSKDTHYRILSLPPSG